MSSIVSPAKDTTYFGMVIINLSEYWKHFGEFGSLTPESYAGYHDMRKWLNENSNCHKFHWINTGNYLPSAVYIDHECAVVFKLRYDV